MPIVRTFVSHHGGDYQARVAPILRQVAPLGIRPWIDKIDLGDRVGLPLDQQIQQAIFSGPCSSLSLFLTKEAATRKWIEQEVQWALERLPEGFRILPILLDPLDEIALPATFREFLERRKVLWLDPQKDTRFLEKYTKSMHAAGGLDRDTPELTLYLGHRSKHWVGKLPPEWAGTPALDIRLSLELTGAGGFCPTEAEWQEIESSLRSLHSYLGSVERLNVCGQAPLGVGTLIGKVWERLAGENGPINLRCYNVSKQQVWTTEPNAYEQSGEWSPERSQHVRMDRPATLHQKTMLLVLLQDGRNEYMRHIRSWNDQREQPQPVYIAHLPEIKDAEHASQVVRECVGLFRFLRRECPEVGLIEVVSVHPLALAALISCHLLKLGPLHFYDEIKGSHTYRLATVVP